MKELSQKLVGCLKAWRPFIYVYGTDFEAIDAAIREAMVTLREDEDMRDVEEYNNACGCVNFDTKIPRSALDEFSGGSGSCAQRLSAYLDDFVTDCPIKRIVVLKDVHEELRDSAVIARLKAIAWRLSNPLELDGLKGYAVQVVVVASLKEIPLELEKLVTVIDVSNPDAAEVMRMLQEYCDACGVTGLSEDDRGSLALSLRGLDGSEILQTLNYVLAQTHGSLNPKEAVGLILNEKKQVIQKSSLLEPVEVVYEEGRHAVGGLRNLVGYLRQKAEIFQSLSEAQKFGVSIPKGILIVGMPGCGKSLAAKECARLFKVPLIRLDIGRLLGRYVGESEENLRRALRHAEGAMPCVLWIDEIEKAFAGVGKDDSGVTTRLFGQFLTWMQEKDARFSTVYVVATANDLSGIPPEFLRRGRFDEIFSVNLPDDAERKEIFRIHLEKRLSARGLTCEKLGLNLDEFVSKTGRSGQAAFSGADIESIVESAIETAFVRHRKDKHSDLSQQDVIKAIEDTRPIRETMAEKIKNLDDSLKKYQVTSASSGRWSM